MKIHLQLMKRDEIHLQLMNRDEDLYESNDAFERLPYAALQLATRKPPADTKRTCACIGRPCVRNCI